MKIIIKDADSNKNFNIRLPMGAIIACLRIGKPILKYSITSSDDDKGDNNKNNIAMDLLNTNDINQLIKGLKYLNKYHKGLVLVDVDDPRGDKVRIEI